MLLLLYCLPFLFKVWQRSGWCCCWYIVYNSSLRFYIGGFLFLLLYCLPLMFKAWQRSGSCCCCYIVYHYCLRFDREVVHVLVVILSIMTVYRFTEEWSMFLLLYCVPLLFKVWQRSGWCCCYIVYHYCLRFYRWEVHVAVILCTITV
jgi:ABC-type polysaccharide/polyol phosphate export permease